MGDICSSKWGEMIAITIRQVNAIKQVYHVRIGWNFQKFAEAAEVVQAFTKRPTDEELLELYALFKQGTVGNNNTSELLFRSNEMRYVTHCAYSS